MPFDAGRRERRPSAAAALTPATLADAPAAAPEDASSAAPVDAYNAASRSLLRMETLLVRLTTDDGATGWGEAFGHLVNPVTFAALAGPVGRFFIGAEVGPDPSRFAATMQAAHQAFHAFGRTGPVLYALSAIDTALWDLCAQAAQLPLHRLLGATRDTVEVYASLVSYDNDPEEVAYQVGRAHAAGFRAMKLHETTRTAVAAARAALPADVALMVDVNCPWPAAQAAREVAGFAGLSLGWVEEPVWPPDDLDALARLRARGGPSDGADGAPAGSSRVPIAAGENASGVYGFLQHFQRGAIDIAQPSVAKIGGVTGMREVIRLAGAHGVRVVPHCFYYGAGLLATAHLVAALPDDVALELPWLQWPEVLHAPQACGPTLTLPDVPGLGFAPDAGVLARHTLDSASIGG
nr:mandelate racemase/muconate lactonizing enzyme family protein [Robbsia betulipollinis]